MGELKKILLFVLGLALYGQTGLAQSTKFSVEEQTYLVNLFTNQFPRNQLSEIFADRRLQRQALLVKKNLHTQETHRDYQGFTSPYSLWLAKKFSRKWRTTLAKASHKYQVDPEAVVAILLVETGFGNVMGKHPVIGVFASLLTEYHHQQHRYPIDPKETKTERYQLKRLEKKAQWAQTELAALLLMSQQNGQSPYHYKGSYAGAFGLPQFLPSSYLKWGVDSDGNGSVNLFWFPDAIHSTANYLKKHGWKRGLEHRENQKAVFAYNHSTPYVNTVLKIARHLRQSQTPQSKEAQVASRETASPSPFD